MAFQPTTKAQLQVAVNTWAATGFSPTFTYPVGGGGALVNNWDTSLITDMKDMFRETSFNSNLIVGWDMSAVTDTTWMFYNTPFNQDIGAWFVGAAGNALTTVGGMFQSSAFNKDISAWNVSNVTDMSSLFLANVAFDQNLGPWNVSNVTIMSHIFTNATGMSAESKSLTFGVHWSANVQWTTGPFSGPFAAAATAAGMAALGSFIPPTKTQLVDGVNKWKAGGWSPAFTYNAVLVNNWDTSLIQDMSQLFLNSAAFNRGEIGSWNTSSVTNMSQMFKGCLVFNQPLATIAAVGGNPAAWDVQLVTNMSDMFSNCADFDQDLSSWQPLLLSNAKAMFAGAADFNSAVFTNTPALTNTANMFYVCAKFNHASVGNMNVSLVTTMMMTFRGATMFNQSLSGWNTSSVTTMEDMFRNATNFNGLVGSWDTTSVTSMVGMFRDAASFNQPIITDNNKWNVSSVTDMQYMFDGAADFNQDIGNWDTSSVTDMSGMFRSTATFNQNIGGWNVINVTNMKYMFNTATAFNYTLELWNVSNVTTFTDIFTGATGLSDANKDLACGEYWSENTNFTQSTSFYTDFKNASGCDPYVMTLTGELYKLDNITGVCRMMQGTLQGKPFVINTMMKLDSENKERQMNEWSSKNAGGLETSNLEMQSFYTHVFVKHGDSECIVDLENGTVRGTHETDLVIKPISGKRSEIPMYNREVCSGGCSIQAGPVIVFAKMFPNRQVRSEIATCGGGAVENADGFAVRPMRTKVCRVKKLTDGGMLTMKRSHYKGEVRERFYSTADKEGKVRTIPRV